MILRLSNPEGQQCDTLVMIFRAFPSTLNEQRAYNGATTGIGEASALNYF
jgi:hypothetical protein